MPSLQKYQEGFVTQALAGDYPPLKENRLTQQRRLQEDHGWTQRCRVGHTNKEGSEGVEAMASLDLPERLP